MRISEILELVRAGYTKDEIAAMDVTQDEKQPTGEADANSGTSGSGEKAENVKVKTESGNEAQAKPEESETEKLVKALGLKLDGLAAAIQTRNVNSMEQGNSNTMTTEEIIANIINPKGGK